jgi:hypothetical protein
MAPMIPDGFGSLFFAGRLLGLLWLSPPLNGWQARPVEGNSGSAW